jgi:hypothetical protein
MPTMSDRHHAFIVSKIKSVDDFQQQLMSLSSEICVLQECWAEVGLVRGLHYTVTPIGKAEINAIHDNDALYFPVRIPLCEIRFRNGRSFDVARAATPDAAREPARP